MEIYPEVGVVFRFNPRGAGGGGVGNRGLIVINYLQLLQMHKEFHFILYHFEISHNKHVFCNDIWFILNLSRVYLSFLQHFCRLAGLILIHPSEEI